MKIVNDEQKQLGNKIEEFVSKTRPSKPNMTKEKEDIIKVAQWHF